MHGSTEEVEKKLREELSKFGEITSMLVKNAKIQEDDKLFAFVCFGTKDAASVALEAWNGKDVFGTGENVYVSWAEPKAIRM